MWFCKFTHTGLDKIADMYLTELEYWYNEAVKLNKKMYGGQ